MAASSVRLDVLSSQPPIAITRRQPGETGLYYVYMRRVIPLAALALFLAVPMWAQRGGGHGGGIGGGHAGGFGGHASFGGSHVGGFGARSGFSTGRMAGPSRGMRSSSVHGFSNRFSRGPFLHDGFRGRFGDRDRFRFGSRNCFGYGCWGGYGYPWWGYGYYDPWLWDWSGDDYSFDQDYNNNLARADQMNEQSLAQQRMWREEQADGDQDAYAPYPSRPRAATSRPPDQPAQNDTAATPIIPPTVLVFRDQHKEEIRNYAIVGQMLWNFAPQRTEKIPLASLDIPATVQANDDRGVTFRVPALTEGQ
jgi:hypothetical protein